jgi:hypothetical protein
LRCPVPILLQFTIKRAMIDQEKHNGQGLHAVEQLLGDYYVLIARLCTNAKKQANKVNDLEKHEKASEYTSLCYDVIAETEQHITSRQDKYLPYIHQLSDKVTAGHDCSNCSGGCKVNHDMHVIELNASNDVIKRVISRLRMTTLPLYSDTLYPDEYRLLRNFMALVENNMAELFALENKYLIPRIIEAQKTINAGAK